ncbi:hypothetical protein GCM10027435_19570 [Haloparvum alkalitolerans]|uniref:metal-dependent hydrolase n=1 Tax=Haloparvum alkalitolerans TaxID=1042953 RepID=UPI003CF8D057
MMQTTHALAGMALAVPVALRSPELAPLLLVAGLVGGALPDLDLYRGHRRTLHFPVYYTVAAALLAAAAAVAGGPWLLAAAVLTAAAALHCLMDVFGGGLELRPWEGRSDRAIYDHARGKWIAPRRWIRYDGSPEDLAIAAVAAAPVLYVADGPLWIAAVGMLAVSAVYVALRRRLPEIAAALASRVPSRFREYVPRRYFE